MSTLDEELWRVKNHFRTIDLNQEPGTHNELRKPRFDDYRTGKLLDVARLRLDWETEESIEYYDALQIVFAGFKEDLEDLFENGDRMLHTPFLNAFDGAKKRGKEIGSVNIIAANLYLEYSPKRKMNDYTLYAVIEVEWK